MIDHIGVRVSDFAVAMRFYDAVFAALGHGRTYSDDEMMGYGAPGQAFFWLYRSPTGTSAAHIAFVAPDRHAVETFHAAGLGAGGKDNGKPGPRPDYGPTYFAAFLLDPDGNNIEAVFNKEPG